MTARPTFDALLAVATASSRHAFARAAVMLDLEPADRQRAAVLRLDTVEEIEAAMQALQQQIGPDRAEAGRLAILAGLTSCTVTMLHTAAAG